MKIVLNTGRVSPFGAGNPGDVIDIEPGEAERMIERGSATPLAEDDTREAKIVEVGENTTVLEGIGAMSHGQEQCLPKGSRAPMR
jgi:hypothetical protein